MSTGTDKARLQTLTDAIIAAQVAAQAIPPDERVADVSFGEFETGGWYWEITTQRNGRYGNTKVATTHKPGDHREHNMREVIECGMTAMRRQTKPKPPIVDHLHEAMQNDSLLVLNIDSGDGGSCRGCGRPVGAYHETSCRLAYRDKGPVVTLNDVDSGEGTCVDCGEPIGRTHRVDCQLIARQRARGSQR